MLQHHDLLAIALATAVLGAVPRPAHAQHVEITPFGGYRVGGSVSSIDGRPIVDDDGGPSVGVVADVVFGSLTDGLKVEAVFSREQATVKVRTSLLDPPARVGVVVDQILVGGIQELADGRARPFLSGLLGITRYAVPGDTEVRFAVGVGAGGKFFLGRHVGLRLDARGYMTIVNLGGTAVCAGGCAVAFDVNPAFQADLTAGLILAF